MKWPSKTHNFNYWVNPTPDKILRYNTRRVLFTKFVVGISLLVIIIILIQIIKLGSDQTSNPLNANNSQSIVWAFFTILGLFVISLIVPHLLILHRTKFMISMALAIIYSLGTLGVVGYAMNEVHKRQVTIPLGVITIMKGTFHEKVPEEYTVLLTSSEPLCDPVTGIVFLNGFGVPLWVLFLSVLGAAIFTIGIIINGITNRPAFEELNFFYLSTIDNYENPKNKITRSEDKSIFKELIKYREMMKQMVQHQFYIFFAPIASMLVYQVLVQAEAIVQNSFVGIVAIGSGFTINLIIRKGIDLSEAAIDKSTVKKIKKKGKQ